MAIEGSGDPYPAGQCTYGAVQFFHDATGVYLPSNLGNAEDWATNAAKDGWNVSASPSLPSVIVLQPGVQGAGPLGHVAVVDAVNSDGSVESKNLNWGSNPTQPTEVKFTPGDGVLFISLSHVAIDTGVTPGQASHVPVDTGVSPLPATTSTAAETNFMKVALFSLGLLFLLAGIGILFKKQIGQAMELGEKAAEVAA